MKKITKTQKQKIKNKLIKIINIVSYILSGLLIIIFVISMCNSCDSKSVNNNDHDSQQRRNNDIQYAINNDSDNDYLLTDTFYYSGYEYFNNYGVPSLSMLDNFKLLEEMSNEVENYLFNLNIHTNSTGYFGVNYIKDFYITETAYNEYTITFVKYYDDIQTFTFQPGRDDDNYIFRINFSRNYNTFINNESFSNYYFIDKSSESGYQSYSFELPPYLVIGSRAPSFIYNIGFTFNDLRYNEIVYNYHDSIIFNNTFDNNSLEWELLTIDDKGNYYFTYRERVYSPISWGDIGTPYYYDDFTTIPTITFTSFGTEGLKFLNDYFVNDNNKFISGTFNFNYDYLLNYYYSYNADDREGFYTIPLKFVFNGEFFQSVTFYQDVKDVTTPNSFIYLYFNYGERYYNPTSLEILHAYWNNEPRVVVSSNVVDDLKDINITIKDEIINVDVFNLIGTWFVPYDNTLHFDIEVDIDTPIGNIFGLLGGAFSGIASILAITIIPGITIGVLLFIPLIIMIILFIVHLFKR